MIGHLRIVDKATGPLRSIGGSITKTIGVLGGLAAAVGVTTIAMNSLNKAMSFEAQMSSIKALTGATADEMKRMQALALKMGAATKYSALEAAQGIEELLKAGLNPAAVEAGGLEAALVLATAGGLDLAEAAETMATSLNAFKKDGMSANDVANILAGTANVAATDVRSLGFALASAGGVADMVGVSFRDFNTAIGLMSNDGLKNGSDAGTSFKSMLMYLQPQTKKSIALFNKLGIGVGKSNKFFKDGKIKDLAEVAELLNTSLKDMSDQDRTKTLLEMFGTDGVKAATSLYKAGAKGVKQFNKEMADVTALSVAKEKMNNAAGAVEQFQGAIETLQISALLPTMPLISRFANAASGMIEQYTPQITAAMERLSSKAMTYWNNSFTNNPEFQKLTTLEAKVGFVFRNIMEDFQKWLDGGGSDKIAGVSQLVVDKLANTLKASEPLIAAAKNVGLAVGKGMLDGMKEFAKTNPELGALMTFLATPGPLPVKLGAAAAVMGYSAVSDISDVINDPNKSVVEKAVGVTSLAGPTVDVNSDAPWWKKALHMKSGGISSVPYNGYPAVLHRGESVLPRGAAREYRNGGGTGGGATVNLNGTVNIHTEADYQAFVQRLATDIDAAGNAMGGVN